MGECCANTVKDDLTTSDGHVVETDEATADFGWCDLCNVKRYDHRGAVDAEANDETADGQLGDGVSGGLQDGSNGEEDAADVDGDLAALLVCR